jgi:hypothetical protein
VNIVKSTRRYEAWMQSHTRLVPADLRLKHQRMKEGPFPFLRSTFYRWMQIWPMVGPELANAPRVLGVGDLHVENFGTWRDIEGRLVWGVNDFDEAAELPFTVDLVRLATSALLAIDAGHLSLTAQGACSAILEGYRKSLYVHGSPFVLEEDHKWLRDIALAELRNPIRFWQQMDSLRTVRGEVPASARDALERLLPVRGLEYRIAHRVAGLGSLGRMRYVAIADCRGGKVAREAKAVVPSSVHWVHKPKEPAECEYQIIINRAVRSPDRFVQLRKGWIVRRLSPHCCRIELSVLPRGRDEIRLLLAMGWETANIHLRTPSARKRIRQFLNRLKPNWLSSAARDLAKVVSADWREWKKSGES